MLLNPSAANFLKRGESIIILTSLKYENEIKLLSQFHLFKQLFHCRDWINFQKKYSDSRLANSLIW